MKNKSELLSKWLKWLMPVSGLLVAIKGISLFFVEIESFETLIHLLGAAMILSGVTNIISFCNKLEKRKELPLLLNGIVGFFLGFCVVFVDGISAMTYFLGYFFLSSGIGTIVAFYKINKKNDCTHIE